MQFLRCRGMFFFCYSGAKYTRFPPPITAAQKALFRVVESGKLLNRLRNGHLEKSAVTGDFSRCTLDCGFKTSESPALRGFVAERGPIRGTSLYLVLKSNGPRSLSLPKVGTHSAFGEKSHTTAYAAKQGRFGWGCCHSRHEPHVPKPLPAGYQNGKLCRFWVLVRCTPEAGVAAPLGCVIFFAFIEIAACTSCA